MRRDWKGKAVYHQRTKHPVRYYIIDYGLSRKFAPEEDSPLANIIVGADKSVPEHQGFRGYQPSNPFSTDIYTAGNLVIEFFASVSSRVFSIGPHELDAYTARRRVRIYATPLEGHDE